MDDPRTKAFYRSKYDQAESEYLIALEAFRVKHSIVFLTAIHHMQVLQSLGYHK